jgi:MFS family permease
MLALGLNDSQVGLTATVYMLSQVVFAFLSGPVTDKMGRRKATAVFDFAAWCVPCLIWWRAEGFWFFIVAALFNGAMQVTTNSWDCLLIEDAEKDQITGINALAIVCGQLSVLFAPISAVLFSRLTLVPAIRILYVNAFVLMSLKIILLYIFSRETRVGKTRFEESRNKSIFSLAAGYGGIIKIIGKSRGTIFALAVTAITGVSSLINNTFWPMIVSKKLLVPNQLLPAFPVMRSVIAIAFFFLVVPRLTRGRLKLPLLTGFCCHFAGQVILLATPVEGPLKYAFLFVSLIFDSFAIALLLMLAASLVALHVDPAERARIKAILNMITMAAVAPFGWIGGILSDVSRNLPFVLNLCTLAAGICITLIFFRKPSSNAD